MVKKSHAAMTAYRKKEYQFTWSCVKKHMAISGAVTIAFCALLYAYGG